MSFCHCSYIEMCAILAGVSVEEVRYGWRIVDLDNINAHVLKAMQGIIVNVSHYYYFEANICGLLKRTLRSPDLVTLLHVCK